MKLPQFAEALGVTLMRAEPWHAPFEAAVTKHKVADVAMLLAQVGHESGGLQRVEENLNYSAQRLMAVWPTRFPTLQTAAAYANNPERLANMVYGGRMGNGDALSGDGWRYRGRGPLQITGADNYRRAGAAIGRPLLQRPELLLEPAVGAEVAAWHFVDCGADGADIDKASDLINRGRVTAKWGDSVGFTDRQKRYEHAQKALKA
jgi:putative chitinase